MNRLMPLPLAGVPGELVQSTQTWIYLLKAPASGGQPRQRVCSLAEPCYDLPPKPQLTSYGEGM